MVVQRSAEWFDLRRGRLTASRMGDATARINKGYGASRANYMAELVCERMTGQTVERYVSSDMRRGTELEPAARVFYEFLFDVEVIEIGFIEHPSIADTGGSPDGLVGTDGLIEIKVPKTANHIETILTKKIDGDYIKQMQWLLACSGRAWADFVTYDDRMPAGLQCWVLRVMRDDKMIAELEKEARLFLAELEEKVEALRRVGRL